MTESTREAPGSAVSLTLPMTVRTATVAQREADGRKARERRPRISIGQFTVSPARRDPVTLLAEQEVIRAQPLLPLRHARMSVSPFTFYRGSAGVMTEDLAAMPNSGLVTQLCGDAHLSNFGLFAAPDRSVIFDINDFDETNPGPFEWDVLRLSTSFVLAGRDRALSTDITSAAATAVGSAYRAQMQEYAGMPDIAVWYDRVGVDVLTEWAGGQADTRTGRVIARGVAKARSRDMWSAVSKLTEVVDGNRRFKDLPPLLMRIPLDAGLTQQINDLFVQYRTTLPRDRQSLLRRYQVRDFGHKVVGVGSVGLLAFVILLEGRDENDLLVLQVKQAVASVLEPVTAESAFAQSGERVVVGQQLMQAASDAFLGWITGRGGRQYYVRQLRDMKFAPDPSKFTGESLNTYAEICGRTLARAHARAGDAVKIAAYLGTSSKFDRALRDFSLSYADQVSKDFAAYRAAIDSGAIPVASETDPFDYRFVDAPTGRFIIDPLPGHGSSPMDVPTSTSSSAQPTTAAGSDSLPAGAGDTVAPRD
jgi:uncharacterized protein (DUF2252 family)